MSDSFQNRQRGAGYRGAKEIPPLFMVGSGLIDRDHAPTFKYKNVKKHGFLD